MSTLKDILEQRGLDMGAKDAPGMAEEKEEQPTADVKLDKAGRKIKASKIVFSQGEDDSTKKVQENMKPTYKDLIGRYATIRLESLQLEDEINEVLSKDASAGEWISDFVHSDNPKFAGKSKEKRKQMALAAYYAKQRNEEVELDEAINADHYTATSEPSKFTDGHRAKVVHKEKGTTMHLSQHSYPTKEKAVEHAKVYLNAYEKVGAMHADREAAAFAKKHAIKEEALTEREGREDDEGYHRTKDSDDAYNRSLAAKAKKKPEAPKKTNEETEQQDIDEGRFIEPKSEKPPKSVLTVSLKQLLQNRKNNPNQSAFKTQDDKVKKYLAMKEEEMNEQLHQDADKVLKHIKPEHHAKYTPDLTTKHYTGNYADRTAVLKAAEKAGHLKEDSMSEAIKWTDGTSTHHDVKKTSTGTVYTKQYDKQGISKGSGGEAADKAEGAAKRGRGRPKKDKFAESVEVLMSLSEEQFDSMMEEGFDAFYEAFVQIDELSKDTLKSYVNKAAHSAVNKGAEFGSRHAAGQEVERFTNRHMDDKFGQQEKMKKAVGGDTASIEAARSKGMQRVRGINKAVEKLTK